MPQHPKTPVPRNNTLSNLDGSFGHFLLGHGFIDRDQLFMALQMQDEHPGIKLGECIAALELIPYSKIITLLKLRDGTRKKNTPPPIPEQ